MDKARIRPHATGRILLRGVHRGLILGGWSNVQIMLLAGETFPVWVPLTMVSDKA